MSKFFSISEPIKYEGPETGNPLAFRHFDAKKKVLGKTMAEHLRLSAAYWHCFTWTGSDPFGGPTMMRPWIGDGDPMALAKLKADVAFDMFALLNMPFFAFHDRDIAPEGRTLAESNDNVRRVAEVFEQKMAQTGVKLLWGTANLFSHPRYMAGAATNPDPDVFAYAAAQVRNVLEVTHRLGGANYVLWGGREGYETLLNQPLDVPEHSEAGGALGAARLGMCAATGADPVAVCTKPPVATVIEPDRNLTQAYSDAYARFARMYRAAKEIMA